MLEYSETAEINCDTLLDREAHGLFSPVRPSAEELRYKGMEDAMAAEQRSLQTHPGFIVYALTVYKAGHLAELDR